MPLRRFLKGRGYEVHGWKQGNNFGLREGVEQRMVGQVKELADRYGRKVSLVGWSLGGLYARQLAKVLPDEVRGVISLGSPFAGSPRATNAWRVYEFVSGHRAEDDEEHLSGHLADPRLRPRPPSSAAPTASAPGRCARGRGGRKSENIEIAGASHCGLGHHPAAVFAIADRLAAARRPVEEIRSLRLALFGLSRSRQTCVG